MEQAELRMGDDPQPFFYPSGIGGITKEASLKVLDGCSAWALCAREAGIAIDDKPISKLPKIAPTRTKLFLIECLDLVILSLPCSFA
jgi:hypothetical protein